MARIPKVAPGPGVPGEPGPDGRPGQAHLPEWPLSWMNDKGWMIGSMAMLSASADADTAVVFVHGFGGKAVATWDDFQEGLRTAPRAARTDAFFWGYPSRRRSVDFCARRLMQFLDDLLNQPRQAILDASRPPGAPLRGDDFRYCRLTLCAHSMGAVVARRALIDLEIGGHLGDPQPRIRLLLFAPAHKGSNLPLMLAAGLGLNRFPGAVLIANAARVWFRSLDDLARGSDTLQRLEKDSRALRTDIEARLKRPRRMRAAAPASGPGREPSPEEATKREALSPARLRARVLHADGDLVVDQGPFDADPVFDDVMNHDHSSICKPTPSFGQPVAALLEVL